jgi:hypothetical protein
MVFISEHAMSDHPAGISRRTALKLGATSAFVATGLTGTPGASAQEGDANYGEPPTSESSRGPNYGGLDGYDDVVEEGDANHVVETAEELADALDSAESGDVVFVPGDAEIDTGTRTVTSRDPPGFHVPEGVTLASDRNVGDGRGGLVYTESIADGWPNDNWVMTAASDARITGLRFRGNYWDWGPVPRSGEDAPHDGYVGGKALLLWDGDWSADPGTTTNVEVDNCEFYGWGAGCVTPYVGADDCHIHHCDFHDCLVEGLGYGVSVGGGYHEIDHNTFDRCRHAITASGAETTGYDAHHNVFGDYSMGSVIDMHCDGGDRIDVHHNTVRAVEQTNPFGDSERVTGVIIRCVPDDEAWIRHNWFYNDWEPLDEPDMWTDEAIVQVHVDEWTNVRYKHNRYGESEPKKGSVGAPHSDKISW